MGYVACGRLSEYEEAGRDIKTLGRTHEIRLHVPAHPTSLGIVRRAAEGLRELCGDEVAQRLTLILSELVTNAIRHAGIDEREHLEILLVVDENGVRGQVTDPGRGFDRNDIPALDPRREGGFGLRIVEELAARWGVQRGRGTTVWFEL